MNYMKKVLAMVICLLLMITTVPFTAFSAQGIIGDANTDNTVNIRDATAIQKYAAGIIAFSSAQFASADVNGDDKANVRDATSVQKYVAGLNTGLNIGKPVGTVTSGIKDSISVCLGYFPDCLDPTFLSGMFDASYVLHVFSGLTTYEQMPDGSLRIVPDCAKALPEPVAMGGGKVSYTYELKDGLKWSDGTNLTAYDFVWSWNRAVAEYADYSYLFEMVDGYDEASYGYGQLNVTALNGGKALKVVLKQDITYFHELLAHPIFVPLRRDIVEDNYEWCYTASTFIGNGPYKVTSMANDKIVMEKNEYYHTASEIKTNKITFNFSDDYNTSYNNYLSGNYQFLNMISGYQENELKENYPAEFCETGVMGTYYISFNVNDPALSGFTQEERTAIRKALGLLLNRNYICDNVMVGCSVPANTFVAMGITDADGSGEFKDNVNGGKGYYSVEYDDYEKNRNEAISILRSVANSSGRFTVSSSGVVSGFPKLSYIYNTNDGHRVIAEYIQSAFGSVGITISLHSMEWGDFLNTRAEGDYSIARNGWVADFNDPISFLDMWITDSWNNSVQYGRDAHANYRGYSYNGRNNLTWSQAYDALIADIKVCKDKEERYELMHLAEDMLMSTGAICPLYYYTDTYLCKEDLEGAFSNPLGFKYFMYAYIPE